MLKQKSRLLREIMKPFWKGFLEKFGAAYVGHILKLGL